MHPTTAPETTTAGSAIAHQPQYTPARKKIPFSRMCAQYKDKLRENGGRTDASDSYMLSLCQQYAKELHKCNLAIYNIKEGAQPYSVPCKALNGVWDVSLTYSPELAGLFVCLWQGAIMAVQLPVFGKVQIENEAAFVDWFCYFGDFKFMESFCVIQKRSGNPKETELNPVREYFHTLLTTNL